MRPSLAFLGNVGLEPRTLVELAQRAEAAGLPGVWMIEYEYDAVAFAHAMLLSTSTIRVGTCIARAFARHPLLLAETASVISLLAPGRFILGIGTGPSARKPGQDSPQRWGMDWKRPTQRMEEYLQILAGGASRSPSDYEGQFYAYSGVEMSPTPPSGNRPPVFLAADGVGMLEVAGRRADGLFAFFVSEATGRRKLEVARAAARQAGRPPEKLSLGVLVMACMDPDREKARAAMRHHLVRYYLNLSTYQRQLDEAGFPDVTAAVRAALGQNDVERAARHVPDAVLDRFTACGNEADIARAVHAICGNHVDIPILYSFPSDGDWLRGYRDIIDMLHRWVP
jgi:alkanesulfonate monooxygenase SsuD/methylene tetrahydromethanopterin reductase-like flavin-dependent oxidoreductase (luciferase family)